MITLTIDRVLLTAPAEFTAEQMNLVAKDAALGVATLARKNFRKLASATKSRFYWHEAAASTQVADEMDEATAYVAIRHKGVRLHWQGGTIRATGETSEVTGRPTRALLIPFEDSPMRKRRSTLHEMHYPPEQVRVLKSRTGAPLLVRAEPMKRKTKLTWLGKLVTSATFKPRADVIPSASAMREAAAKAGKTAIRRIIHERKDTPPTEP